MLATDHGSSICPIKLSYCDSEHLYPALVLIREHSDKRESDITCVVNKET